MSYSAGDVIYVVRAPLSFEDGRIIGNRSITYRHYGIAVGDGTVIHFVGSAGYFSGDIRVRHTPLSSFTKGGNIYVEEYGTEDSYPARVILERAFSQLGSNFGGYSLINNNCEHFAFWAATGRKVSRQALLASPYNPEQDFVSNQIDRMAAGVDKVFDPLIEWGDKVDKFFGWGRYR